MRARAVQEKRRLCLGEVRCIDVDPTNEWFVTSGNDRLIKIWDLATGTLKLTLTGHSSNVRDVKVRLGSVSLLRRNSTISLDYVIASDVVVGQFRRSEKTIE